MCKFYRKDSYTCNHQDEAETYCGTYNIFESYKAKVKDAKVDI